MITRVVVAGKSIIKPKEMVALLNEEITILLNALDLACEYLEFTKQFYGFNYDERKSSFSKEEWKEWLLKEVQRR